MRREVQTGEVAPRWPAAVVRVPGEGGVTGIWGDLGSTMAARLVGSRHTPGGSACSLFLVWFRHFIVSSAADGWRGGCWLMVRC
jgi:hypothetical protein